MKRIWISVVVIILLTPLLAWQLGWLNWQKTNDPLQAVFETPFFLMSGTGPLEIMTDSIAGHYEFPLLREISTSVSSLNDWVESWPSAPNGTNWVLAAYKSGNDAPGVLFIAHDASFSRSKPELQIPDMDSIHPAIEERRSGKDKVYHIRYQDKEIVLARMGDLIMVSTSAFLVESALKSIRDGGFLQEEAGFQSVRTAMSGEECIHLHLPSMLSFLKSSGRLPEFPGQAIRAPGGWVSLQFKQATGMLLVDGYLEAEEPSFLLHDYLTTRSGNTSLASMVPAGTDYLWERVPGTSFRQLLKDNRAAQEEYQVCWNDWVGDTWATAANLYRDSVIHWDPVLILASRKVDALDRLTPLMVEGLVSYRGKDIYSLKPSAVLSVMAGIKDSAFCVEMNDHILFSAEVSRLKEFVDAGWSKKSLATRGAVAMVDSISLSAWNQWFFLDLQMWASLYPDAISSKANLHQQHNPLMVQLNPHNGLFLINAYLPEAMEESESTGSWAYGLEAPVAVGPYAMFNQLTGTDCFVVQDEQNQLYLIDTRGSLIWKRSLDQPIVGEIRTVDFYENNKYQLLFSTSHSIQLIDMKGNDVEGFPIRISAEVTSGLSAIDYEKNGNYRMFVGCANGNTYGFYKNGKPLKGWKPLKSGVVTVPVGHSLSGGKDYLYYVTAGQELQVRSRRGDLRYTPVPVPEDRLFDPVPDKTSEPGALLVMKSGGDLIRIDWSGKVTSIPFASGAHHALAADIDRDGETDILYANSAGIFAVDQGGKVIFHVDPGDPLSCRLQLLPGVGGYRILISVTTTGQSYLADEKGNLYETDPFPLSGRAAWTGKPWPILVVADGEMLQSYLVD